mgnify:CR=1 FL=1
MAASKYRDGWIQHVEQVTSTFLGVLKALEPSTIVIEIPALWSGSAVSHASAAAGKDGDPGDLFKLTYLVGQLGYLTKKMTGNLPVLILPYEWKGQMPKEVVLERIAAYGIQAKDHEGDAIGMGLAAQGAL